MIKKECYLALGNAHNMDENSLTSALTECGEMGQGVHDSVEPALKEAQEYVSPAKVYKVTIIFEEVAEC